MSWRWVHWGAGAVLLVLACLVLLLQVSVHDAGTPPRACGSAWDAVTGRAGWQRWWAADLSDPALARGGQLIRTLRCPDAVNGRIATSAGLALGAATVLTVGEVVALRRARRTSSVRSGPARRLRLFGTVAAILGGLLTAGGLAGITILAANPSSPIFLYVSRPLAVLVGLLLLLPAILLTVLGYGVRLMADYLARAEPPRETP